MFELSALRVMSLLNYDAKTGAFTWRVSRGRNAKAGDVAGCPNEWGHIRIKIDGRLYMAHQLAWLLMTGTWPQHQIDHRDTNPENNAWLNLRAATSGQNMCNIGLRKDNKVGLKGVCWNNWNGKFSATIRSAGKQRHLGYFVDPVEAHEVYCLAAEMLHGEFANLGHSAPHLSQ
ncbi:Fis family transcriptional regulator [Burkholderia thailandensis]|nr:Fis family transcriptional regulator [Burkholderia thailandensis]